MDKNKVKDKRSLTRNALRFFSGFEIKMGTKHFKIIECSALYAM